MAARETLLGLRLNQWSVGEVMLLSGKVCWRPTILTVMVQVMAKNSAIPMEMANRRPGPSVTNPGDPDSKPQKPVEPVAPEIVIQTSKSPFGFQFKTVEGQTYEIQATTDLRKWTVIDTIEGTGSDKVFSDLREAVFELQYYRVRVRD